MERDEFLRDIAAHPEDTERRLVFADWLEQHGEANRATFIRTECALVGVPKYDLRWAKHWTWAREHEGARELPALPSGLAWHSFAFERGFAARLRVTSLDAFVAHAHDIFARSPVRRIEFDARDPAFAVDRLVACPELATVKDLTFHLGRFDGDAIASLVESEHLGSLERLAFAFGGLAEAGVIRLLQPSPLLPRLRQLHIDGDFFIWHGAPLAKAFAAAPPLPNLKELVLNGHRLDDRVLGVVLDVPELAPERLGLSNNQLGDTGWGRLTRWPGLQGVRRLHLAGTQPRVAAFRELIASPAMSNVVELSIGANRRGPRAGRALLDAEHMTALRSLGASHNQLGDACVRAIFASPRLAQLEQLDIWSNGLSPDMEKAALRWRHDRAARTA